MNWVRKVFKKSVPEMAKILGVDPNKLGKLLSEVDPDFWKDITVKELTFSFDKDGRLKGYSKLLKEKGIPVDSNEIGWFRLYDFDLSKKEKELKEKERYLRILDNLSSYSFAYHDRKDNKGVSPDSYEAFVKRESIKDKTKMKRQEYHIASYHPSVPVANKALILVHRTLGPIAAITTGEVKDDGSYVPYVDRLIVHPILSDKDFEFRVKDSKWADLPKGADPKELKERLVKNLEEWDKEHKGQKNKLSVGTILLLKAMVDLPEFHIDANHRTQGVMRKIEERLGKKFFFAKNKINNDYKRFVFSRVKRPK